MNLEEKAVAALKEKGYRITTAESCTAGMIASRLVNVSGISDVYKQGYITYSDEAKMNMLHVDADVIARYGVVSQQTAQQMAQKAAAAADTEVAVSSTGIAGPDGGTKEKPVGLVYLACFVKGRTEVWENIFRGDRQAVREQATQKALELILKCIEKW